ncbi:hypothetical protein JRO89_XS12G0232600 [Xanthoceras sorbifolium]|uniref:WRKY domain-containing protein n=1 Tax=Xanthoceras sorbifolium TaxID=99658 RepID=A0ABQ8HDF6_9ROSI|nr:hypothetical protein JRO89_XS12G0232600 [Xanthoceras sorbifolium]
MATGKVEEGSTKKGNKRPTITPPSRAAAVGSLSMESPFWSGGLSPGPMTLVSRFFSDDSNYQSFSQLLAGAMASPLARPPPPLPFSGDGDGFEEMGEKSFGGFKESRPGNLMVARPPLFTVPPGLSPSGLLNSPAFFSPPVLLILIFEFVSDFVFRDGCWCFVEIPNFMVMEMGIEIDSLSDDPYDITTLYVLIIQGFIFSPSLGMDSHGMSPLGESPFGISHQQALAQVTAQAALAQSQMHMQTEYQPSSVSAPAESLVCHQSFSQGEASRQQMTTSSSDRQSSVMERSEVSHSDGKHLQPSVAADKPADDGYNWRKYGQKPIKGSEYPRSYYKCTHLNCLVKKKVERSSEGQIAQIIYKNEHNHEKPQLSRRAKDGTDVNGNLNSQSKPEHVFQGPAGNFSNQASETVPALSVLGSNREYNQAAPVHLADSSDSEEQGHADNRKEGDDDEPNPKRRQLLILQPPVLSFNASCSVNRSYYKCTHAGCNVRKHVERAPTDPKAVITTYEGKHNHDVPAARNSSHNAANNSAPQPKPNQLVTDKHPLLKDMDFGNNGRRPVLLQLKEEQIVV